MQQMSFNELKNVTTTTTTNNNTQENIQTTNTTRHATTSNNKEQYLSQRNEYDRVKVALSTSRRNDLHPNSWEHHTLLQNDSQDKKTTSFGCFCCVFDCCSSAAAQQRACCSCNRKSFFPAPKMETRIFRSDLGHIPRSTRRKSCVKQNKDKKKCEVFEFSISLSLLLYLFVPSYVSPTPSTSSSPIVALF